MDPIEKLLAEVQAESKPSAQESPQQPQSQPDWQTSPPPAQSLTTDKGPTDKRLDDLLSQVKTEFDQADQVEAEKRAEQLKQEALKQEQIRKEKQAKLTKQAVEWLKNLDSYSDEGFWFEQFAEKFPTRLDAAIAYLEAMPSSNSSP
jgi:vacuolar-type H+-ATPase subunit I/STV1